MSSNGQELVDRRDLTRAFQVAGEPLELALDFAVADPESAVDAIYVERAPRSIEEAYEVVLMDGDDDAAARQVALLERVEENLYVLRHKNVIIWISPEARPARRDRLVAIIRSL